MNWKEYLISKGLVYSEPNDDYRIGYGWGRSIKVTKILGSLFEVSDSGKIVFSHFVESFDKFKTIIDDILESRGIGTEV